MSSICRYGGRECSDCGRCIGVMHRREKRRFECILCDAPIYEDDIYYDVDGEKFCRHCIEKGRRTA